MPFPDEIEHPDAPIVGAIVASFIGREKAYSETALTQVRRCVSRGRRTLAEQMLARLLVHRDGGRRWIDLLCLVIGSDRRRARLDHFEPALHIRKIVEVLALVGMRYDPRIGGHVGNRIFAS